jgi:hypothetical protein
MRDEEKKNDKRQFEAQIQTGTRVLETSARKQNEENVF